MAVSENLEIPLLTEAMTQKTIAINLALDAFEKALTDTLELNTDAAVSNGYDLLLPYDNTNDISDRTALRFMKLTLLAGATANFDVIHPANPHMFVIENKTAYTATIKCSGGGSNITVPTNSLYLLYCDGTNILRNNFTIDTLRVVSDANFAYYANPLPDALLGRVYIGRETLFAANFAGSIGRTGVAPANPVVISVYDDATKIGEITINSSGNFSFTTTGGTAKTVAANSLLELRYGSYYDNLITDIYVNLLGHNTVIQ